MVYQVKFDQSFYNELAKIDKKQRDRIKKWVQSKMNGTVDLSKVDFIHLVGEKHKIRFRIGNYRILAILHNKENLVYVYDIGHRSDVYKKDRRHN